MKTTKTELNLDQVNPYEVRKGINLELEGVDGDRKKATKKVLENLAVHPAYYSELEHYNSTYMNEAKKPSFKAYLKNKNKDNEMTKAELRESIKNSIKILLKEGKEYSKPSNDPSSGSPYKQMTVGELSKALLTFDSSDKIYMLAAEYDAYEDEYYDEGPLGSTEFTNGKFIAKITGASRNFNEVYDDDNNDDEAMSVRELIEELSKVSNDVKVFLNLDNPLVKLHAVQETNDGKVQLYSEEYEVKQYKARPITKAELNELKINKNKNMTKAELRKSIKEIATRVIKEEYTEYVPEGKGVTNNIRLLNQVQGSLNTLTHELKELAVEYSKNKDKSVVGKMRRYNEERKQLESTYNKLLASELTETETEGINVPYSPSQVITSMQEAINNFEMVMKNISLNGWMGEQVGVNERKKIERNYEEVRSNLIALEESLDEMLEGWKN